MLFFKTHFIFGFENFNKRLQSYPKIKITVNMWFEFRTKMRLNTISVERHGAFNPNDT